MIWILLDCLQQLRTDGLHTLYIIILRMSVLLFNVMEFDELHAVVQTDGSA